MVMRGVISIMDDDEFDDGDQEGSDYQEMTDYEEDGNRGYVWELCESILRHLTSRLRRQTRSDDGGVAGQENGHNENLQASRKSKAKEPQKMSKTKERKLKQI
ncbi:hypothetical protein J5N97_004993 [Dioscorea zingiberensis]|uniref:Uncharacterized protein n=1 Tax=Dioscorea zingiberensis TaxID=325984 RepID=A0A9D5D9H6_9LILI|nr:hypothetical protein J5N97_004993 [Dioscorea zingiberensis]